MKEPTRLHDAEKRQKWIEFIQNFHPDIDPQTVRLMDELRFVSRSIHHRGEQSVEEAGLSFAQYRVLMHLFYAEQLGDQQELNPSEMSDRQGVSRNTMSAFIRNLEDLGFVARHLDENDRRRFNISLTENGRSLVSQYAHNHLQSINHCFDVLTADEQQTMLNLLQKLGTHVTAVCQQNK